MRRTSTFSLLPFVRTNECWLVLVFNVDWDAWLALATVTLAWSLMKGSYESTTADPTTK